MNPWFFSRLQEKAPSSLGRPAQPRPASITCKQVVEQVDAQPVPSLARVFAVPKKGRIPEQSPRPCPEICHTLIAANIPGGWPEHGEGWPDGARGDRPERVISAIGPPDPAPVSRARVFGASTGASTGEQAPRSQASLSLQEGN
jgi:hypothetical protein